VSVRHEHLDAEVIKRFPRREPLWFFDAEALAQQAVVPVDILTVAINKLIVGV
jgi:hypothetical protein